MGVLLALLLFCKVNFFVLGVAAVVIRFIMRPSFRISMVSQVIGFLLICFGMQSFLQISIYNYIADIILAGHAQSFSHRLSRLLMGLEQNLLTIFLNYAILLIFIITKPEVKMNRKDLVKKLKLCGTITFIIVSVLLITAGNASEGGDIPIFFVSGLILLDYISENMRKTEKNSLTMAEINYLWGLVFVVSIFFGNVFLKDTLSLTYSVLWKEYRLSSVPITQRFQSETLRDFVIPQTSDWKTAYWRAKYVPNRINDGLDLLRRHVSADSKVFAFALTNPFSFALELPPPKGAPLWWDKNFSFNHDFYPKPEKIFMDTDIVMIPKFHDNDDGCCKSTVYLMKEVYCEYLKERFYEKDHSEFWILLEKRDGLDPGIGHFVSMTPQQLSASTAVRVETKKLPRHP